MTTTRKRESKDLVGAKRWAAYATAGAASVVGAQAAEAAITHVVVNTTITIAGSTQSFSLGGAGTLLANVLDVPAGGAALALVGNGSIAGFIANSFPYAANLAPGQNVSTASFGLAASQTATLAYGFGYGNDQFLDTGGFLGFRFDGGAGTQYGWARFELLTGTPSNEYTLVDYAYGAVDEPIMAGQTAIPLPGSIWLLASGAAGLIGWRKARQMSTKAA